MNETQDSSYPGRRLGQKQKGRIDYRDRRLHELEAEVRELRKEVWKLQKDQARLLGYLEGKGLMG